MALKRSVPLPRKLARAPIQERSREVVKAIVQAAERELSKGDRSAVTMQRIAHVAGVSKGTLYSYFRSLDEVVKAVEEHSWACVIAQIAEVVQGPEPPSPEDGIERVVRTAMAAIRKRASLHGLTIEFAGDATERRRVLSTFAAIVQARLESRVERDQIRPSDVRLATELVTRIVPFLVSLGMREFEDEVASGSFDEIAATLVRSFLLRDSR